MSPAARLRGAEILILPTDSIPGLHALATLHGARDRLAALKQVTAPRGFLLLFGEPTSALALVQPPAQSALLEQLWPGPYTLLLRPQPWVQSDWLGPEGKLALRVPAHAGLRALLRELDAPLFSSSVNRTGEEAASDLAAAQRRFPDLVAVDLAGASDGRASTLIDLCDPSPRLLRAGAGAWPLGSS